MHRLIPVTQTCWNFLLVWYSSGTLLCPVAACSKVGSWKGGPFWKWARVGFSFEKKPPNKSDFSSTKNSEFNSSILSVSKNNCLQSKKRSNNFVTGEMKYFYSIKTAWSTALENSILRATQQSTQISGSVTEGAVTARKPGGDLNLSHWCYLLVRHSAATVWEQSRLACSKKVCFRDQTSCETFAQSLLNFWHCTRSSAPGPSQNSDMVCTSQAWGGKRLVFTQRTGIYFSD